MRVSCLTDNFFSNFRANFFSFFQLSIQNFLGFFYFRAENFPAFQLSNQKILPDRNFSACVPGTIGRAGMCAGACVPSEPGQTPGVFLGFRCDRPEIFGINGHSRSKKVCELWENVDMVAIAGTDVRTLQ
jgi:hypothetical protein